MKPLETAPMPPAPRCGSAEANHATMIEVENLDFYYGQTRALHRHQHPASRRTR